MNADGSAFAHGDFRHLSDKASIGLGNGDAPGPARGNISPQPASVAANSSTARVRGCAARSVRRNS